jgi:hypothetical protein
LEVEDSRELTHKEIWEDSALIEAWNAATEEYQVGPCFLFVSRLINFRHTMVPIKVGKMSLFINLLCRTTFFRSLSGTHIATLRWYNIPPPPSKKQKKSPSSPPAVGPGFVAPSVEIVPSNGYTQTVSDLEEPDSKPFDLDTFVPTHDPGLSSARDQIEIAPEDGPSKLDNYAAGVFPGQMVSQDEAFQRALDANYWCGYWTAVYHVCFAASFLCSMVTRDLT